MTTLFFIFAFLVVSAQTYHNVKYYLLNLKWNDPKELEKRLVVVRRETVEFLESKRTQVARAYTEQLSQIDSEISEVSSK